MERKDLLENEQCSACSCYFRYICFILRCSLPHVTSPAATVGVVILVQYPQITSELITGNQRVPSIDLFARFPHLVNSSSSFFSQHNIRILYLWYSGSTVLLQKVTSVTITHPSLFCAHKHSDTLGTFSTPHSSTKPNQGLWDRHSASSTSNGGRCEHCLLVHKIFYAGLNSSRLFWVWFLAHTNLFCVLSVSF